MDRPIDVLLVTKDDCSFCDEVKVMVGHASVDLPLQVRFVGFDTEEGRTLAVRNGALFPPLVFVGGGFLSYGRLSERRFRKAVEVVRRTGR